MQNAECRMQNAESRMQNAECRMQNALSYKARGSEAEALNHGHLWICSFCSKERENQGGKKRRNKENKN
jgi:Tfp pilus assembly protein PilX